MSEREGRREKVLELGGGKEGREGRKEGRERCIKNKEE